MNRAMAAAGVPPRERLVFLVQAGCPAPAALAEVCRGLPQEPLELKGPRPAGGPLGVRPWNLVRFLLDGLGEGLVALQDALAVLEGCRIHPWSLACLGEPLRPQDLQALGEAAGLPDDLLARCQEPPGNYRCFGLAFGDAGLEWLPGGLKTGPITIEHCPLAEIGPGLEVEGRLELVGCGLLPTLPEDFRALEPVRIRACTSFHAMPSRFTAPGLHLTDLPLLERLALPTSFHGTLEVRDCPSFRDLSLGSLWLERLELVLCPLALLPADLRLTQDLRLEGLPVRALPDNLQVGGDCRLYNLHSLRAVGPGTAIAGNLSLAGLPFLRRLPEDLQVGGQVRVHRSFDQGILPGHLRGRVALLKD